MTQHFRSKLEDMNGSDNPMSNCQGGDVVNQRTSVSDHVNGLQHSTARSDVFVVNMERFSHIVEKDINANSRIALQRSLSRKGPARTGEKKISVNDRDSNTLSSSPRVVLTPQKISETANAGVTIRQHLYSRPKSPKALDAHAKEYKFYTTMLILFMTKNTKLLYMKAACWRRQQWPITRKSIIKSPLVIMAQLQPLPRANYYLEAEGSVSGDRLTHGSLIPERYSFSLQRCHAWEL
ncbi:uncharacterized protein LOC127249451 isoform X1 [Andrographis paniculata]|uniref:uncharacterized protein LOC127249451 isoform X1 n=1 Tax=Andrographis paniculata TaxID=175694 RepID=UPI0021E92CEC|nr:uncharacterized protein LOC127249451 isoform X1 [Andrographis paniculata]